jgi:hypothetical protein
LPLKWGEHEKVSGSVSVDHAARGPDEERDAGTGYSILQAESKDALMALLKNHPHFMAPGASIEVFEFLPMPGM